MTSAEPAILSLLREALERAMPGRAAALLFEALMASDVTPSSFIDVLDLVQGPLRTALELRVGETKAREIVRELEGRLRFAELPTAQISAIPPRMFDEITTKLVPRVEHAASILVIGRSLGDRIAAALDDPRGRVASIRSEADLAAAGAEAHLALLDASDPIEVAVATLARHLARVPLVLLWGSDTALAPTWIGALERAGVPVMAFSRAEPADALVDVLRARLEADPTS